MPEHRKISGPSGTGIVIIRDDLIAQVPENQHSMLDYRLFAEKRLHAEHAKHMGHLFDQPRLQMAPRRGRSGRHGGPNEERLQFSTLRSTASDGYYIGHADRSARSLMNVTFRLPSEDWKSGFARRRRPSALTASKAHRSVGGIRASIYNGLPREGGRQIGRIYAEFFTS